MKVELLGVFGDDLMVVNAARISYDRWSDSLSDKDIRLIQRMARRKENSPFYHPQIQFRITAPFYVAAQLKRHHIGLTINEVSRRYATGNPEVDLPTEWRGSPNGPNPQVSSGPMDPVKQSIIADRIDDVVTTALDTYNDLIASGVAPEQARVILPVATETTWLWTGSLFAYVNLCRERLAPDVQPETRAVAERIAEEISQAFPVSWDALMGVK